MISYNNDYTNFYKFYETNQNFITKTTKNFKYALKPTKTMAEEDETIYDEEGREEMVEDSEISPEEEGFMQGYDKASEEEPEEEDSEEKKDSKEKKKKE